MQKRIKTKPITIDINEKKKVVFPNQKTSKKNCCMCINPSKPLFTSEKTQSVSMIRWQSPKAKDATGFFIHQTIVLSYSIPSRIPSPEITIVNVWSTDRQATLDTTHQSSCNWSRINRFLLHQLEFLRMPSINLACCIHRCRGVGLTLSVFAATVMVTSFS